MNKKTQWKLKLSKEDIRHTKANCPTCRELCDGKSHFSRDYPYLTSFLLVTSLTTMPILIIMLIVTAIV